MTATISARLVGGRRPSWRAAAVIAAVGLAYHFSLASLLRGLTLQTPLAYLGLVPAGALILAVLRGTRSPRSLPIHDRQLDYIIGLAFVGFASCVVYLGPKIWPIEFWLLRVDLLTLPFFTAGIVALLYGVRAMWHLRGPLAVLFLAWPVPYVSLLGEGMRWSVDATQAVLASGAAALPALGVVPSQEGVFFIRYGDQFFPLAIASACAGANSFVGFLLLGGAMTILMEGPAIRRIAWLTSGLLFSFLANLLRIGLIFVAGHMLGPHAAFDLLHPVLGLVLFNLVTAAMLIAMPAFGIRLSFEGVPPQHPVDPAYRRVAGAFVLCLGLAVLGALLQVRLSGYDKVASGTGQPRLGAFSTGDVAVRDWSGLLVAHYEQGRQFYGENSTWRRYLYSWGPAAELRAAAPVYVDVVDTDDSHALSAYGLEACYQFHGYELRSIKELDLGAGGTARVVTYHNPQLDSDWTAVWWEWPYAGAKGTMYERVVVFATNGASRGPAAPQELSRHQMNGDEASQVLATIARSLVASRASATPIP